MEYPEYFALASICVNALPGLKVHGQRYDRALEHMKGVIKDSKSLQASGDFRSKHTFAHVWDGKMLLKSHSDRKLDK
jgi:hypothetical protein